MWSKIRENIEVFVLVVLLVLLATCVKPVEAFMPAVWEQSLIFFFIALYGFYAGILFRLPPKDEREQLHLTRAERIGFLVGMGLAFFFIIMDILGKPNDKALIFVLGGMVFTKLAVLLVYKHRN